ncbi:MAG: hypothetical protein LBR67_10185 [Dysgonamonadaceae bacterium]|jgi:hypothetical protein|nr:hypothetical protein [Dysgonamonadaceae bacterium]
MKSILLKSFFVCALLIGTTAVAHATTITVIENDPLDCVTATYNYSTGFLTITVTPDSSFFVVGGLYNNCGTTTPLPAGNVYVLQVGTNPGTFISYIIISIGEASVVATITLIIEQ